MKLDILYPYFLRVMKAGSARGGKYKNRTWKGDHWEYEYDEPKGNSANQDKEKPQKPKTIRADRKDHDVPPEMQKKVNEVIRYSLPAKDTGGYTESQLQQIQERKDLISDPKTTSQISKWSKDEYMVTLKNGNKENSFMIKTPWNLMDMTNHPLAKKESPKTTEKQKLSLDDDSGVVQGSEFSHTLDVTENDLRNPESGDFDEFAAMDLAKDAIKSNPNKEMIFLSTSDGSDAGTVKFNEGTQKYHYFMPGVSTRNFASSEILN